MGFCGAVERVKNQRYLYRRGDAFVFRRGVPTAYRRAFGKTEVRKTLNARSVSDASIEMLPHNREFEARLRRCKFASGELMGDKPSLQQIEASVREWFAARQQRFERYEKAGKGEEERAHRLLELDEYEVEARAAIRGDKSETWTTDWIVDTIIDQNGWAIEKGCSEYLSVRKVVGRGQLEASRKEREDLEGLPRASGDTTFASEAYSLDELRREREQFGSTITQLFEDYIGERRPSPATIKSYRQKIGSFVTFLGHDEASRVTAKDVVAWKEMLLSKASGDGQGLSAKTVNDTYLAVIRSTFRWGLENERLKSNPAKHVKVRSQPRAMTRSKGLKDQEANKILAAASQPASSRLSPERALARRWVPWLCAYTGARVNEITQVRAEDVKKVDGVWGVEITPDAGSTKNYRARFVPLHSHLIEQEFVKFAQEKGTGPLFYDPERHRGGSDANPQSKKVGEALAKWVRELGVDHPEVQPNHGWRHRFKTIARNVDMSEEIRDAIQGHVPRTEGEAYGDVSAIAMQREIEKLPRYRP